MAYRIGLIAVFTWLLLAKGGNSYGQNLDSSRGNITFVKQIAASELQKSKNSFKEKLKWVIFGTKRTALKKPVACYPDRNGGLWILDQDPGKILYLKPTGELEVPHFIEKKGFNFSSLVGICAFKENSFLITDSHLKGVFVLNGDKKTFQPLNESLNLERPTGIVYDPVKKIIWVTETGKHRLVALNENGIVVDSLGQRGIAPGEFNYPTHISLDKKGALYVSDAMNFRIQVFDKLKNNIAVFGRNGDGSGSMASPKGIAVDSRGNIYLVDALFHAIQLFNLKGEFLYSFGGQGTEQSQFYLPTGLTITSNDLIYISDTYNSRIQVFQYKPII